MKTCSDCKENKPESEFYKQTDRKNGASKCKTCFNRYCAQRWVNIKIRAIEHKGGKCSRCGLKDHYSVFAFHHRNPLEKDHVWTKLRLKSWDKILLELEKCDLVCHNCHSKIHWEFGLE